MKLWLDDTRMAPKGWVQARSVDEAIGLISMVHPAMWEDASLDNDLGEYADQGGDGYKLVQWMIEVDRWPRNKPTVHSMNPVRSQTMRQDIERYWHD